MCLSASVPRHSTLAHTSSICLFSLILFLSLQTVHMSPTTVQNRASSSLTRSCALRTAFFSLSLSQFFFHFLSSGRLPVQFKLFRSFARSFITLIGVASLSLFCRCHLKTLESGKCTFVHSFIHSQQPMSHGRSVAGTLSL